MLYEALQKENMASEQDLDLDDITSSGPTQCPPAPNPKSKPLENPIPIGGLSLTQLQEKANQVITYEWVRRNTNVISPNHKIVSIKASRDILMLCVAAESVADASKK